MVKIGYANDIVILVEDKNKKVGRRRLKNNWCGYNFFPSEYFPLTNLKFEKSFLTYRMFGAKQKGSNFLNNLWDNWNFVQKKYYFVFLIYAFCNFHLGIQSITHLDNSSVWRRIFMKVIRQLKSIPEYCLRKPIILCLYVLFFF